MTWWLLAACLGVLPNNQSPTNTVVVVQGVPAPIVSPVTTATTVAPTTLPAPPPTAPGNANMMPLNPTNPSAPGTVTPPATGMPPPSMGTGMPPSVQTSAGTPATMPSSPATGTNQPPTNTAAPGLPLIDPRLGTTPGPFAPPLVAYSGPSIGSDAVKFPKVKRSLMDVITGGRYTVSKVRQKRQQPQQTCSCVPAGTCYTGQTNFGAGFIDFRIVTPGAGGGVNQCPAGQQYCCGPSGTTVACGTRQTVPATGLFVAAGQADFGEYPWQALILTNQNEYVAGGVLVDQYNVLTVVHRLTPYIVQGTVPNVKVRLGEWDVAATTEPIPYQEYSILRVFTHPQFNAGTLQYDIAVLRLSRPVPLTPAAGSAATINRACLPASSAATYTGQRCWVTGWGQNAFGTVGQYQQILKEVDVPIVDSSTCEAQLRQARLGPTFTLDRNSFICAGGEANKDACTGDGGSGLVCLVGSQWTVVGLVTWGLGCASPSVPAAYVNLATLLPWIQQQIATT